MTTIKELGMENEETAALVTNKQGTYLLWITRIDDKYYARDDNTEVEVYEEENIELLKENWLNAF